MFKNLKQNRNIMRREMDDIKKTQIYRNKNYEFKIKISLGGITTE